MNFLTWYRAFYEIRLYVQEEKKTKYVMMFCYFLSGVLWYSITGFTVPTDCRLPGVLYQGTKNVTETGRPCQRWDTQSPHEHNYDIFNLAQENYCRNFDREEPWCFTNDSNVRWELCGVDVCDSGLISPCRDPNLINNSLRMMNVGVPCFYKSVKRSKTVSCRNIQRAAHCVISRLNDETNNTCDVKDKIYLAKKFLAIFPEQSRVNASICIKEFLSEFPATIDNTTDTITLLRDKEASTYSQTHVFLAIGFTLVMVFVASVIICIFGIRKTLMRKKRKELMPLPVIQNAEDPSYEIDLAYPDGLYHDPDYESIDDQEEGYERLPGEIEEMRSQNLVDNDVGGEYTAPNNADGTYLDVVHPKIYSHDYTNVNPYLELVEKTVECQTVLDTKDIPK